MKSEPDRNKFHYFTFLLLFQYQLVNIKKKHDNGNMILSNIQDQKDVF